MRSDPDKNAGTRRKRVSLAGEPSEPSTDDAMEPGKSYRVGKGHPPLHSRFKPGGKGGPGRPKGSKNSATLFAEAMDTARPVTVDGKRRRMTSQELGYRQLALQVAKGDLKALGLAEQIRARLSGPEEVSETAAEPLTEAELAIWSRRSDG